MPKAWIDDGVENGICTVKLDSWASFYAFVEQLAPTGVGGSDGSFVWRGQRNPEWSLSPSLDRLLAKIASHGDTDLFFSEEERVQNHLELFRLSVRGRRGPNPPNLPLENDWWALGQHYGLATPLLDWTKAPFAAAYFAFEDDGFDTNTHRVIYGLDRHLVELRNFDLANRESLDTGRPPLLEFYEPMSDENPRLVAQGGLFTRAPLGMPAENWISTHFEESVTPALYRVLIPCRDRVACLRALNRMNINHLSLFPDLNGASRFVNLTLEDPTL